MLKEEDVDAQKHVDDSLVQIWKPKFGYKIKSLSRLWAQGLVKILKFKFSRNADFWLRFWSCCLVEILKMKSDPLTEKIR